MPLVYKSAHCCQLKSSLPTTGHEEREKQRGRECRGGPWRNIARKKNREKERFYLTYRASERAKERKGERKRKGERRGERWGEWEEGIRSKSWALKAEAVRRKNHDERGRGRVRSVCEKRERESGGEAWEPCKSIESTLMNTIRGVNCEGLPTRRKRHSRERTLLLLAPRLPLDVDRSQFFFFLYTERHVFTYTCQFRYTHARTFPVPFRYLFEFASLWERL